MSFCVYHLQFIQSMFKLPFGMSLAEQQLQAFHPFPSASASLVIAALDKIHGKKTFFFSKWQLFSMSQSGTWGF